MRATLQAAVHEATLRRCRVLGEVWAVKCLCKNFDEKGFVETAQLINAAIQHDQIKVFFNSFGEPVGYVVWALLAEDVEHRFIATQNTRLHLSEWYEGDTLWFLETRFAPGYLPDAIGLGLTQLFADFSSVRFARRRGDTLLFKQVDASVFRRAVKLMNADL